MKLENHKFNIKFNSLKITTFFIAFVVVCLTIAYSAFSDSLTISDASATVMVQRVIRITGLNTSSIVNGTTTSLNEHGINSIRSNVTLPNNNSKITYDIQVTNFGNTNMGIIDITGLPSNLKYTISNYTLGDILCDDTDNNKCTLGSVSTIHITVSYANNGYDSSNTNYIINMDLVFHEIDYVARIGNTNYTKLQYAVDAVPVNNEETTIVLLKSISERVTVLNGKNILLDFDNYTLSNDGNSPVIETQGTVKMTNGTITSNASQGAINVEENGLFIMTGGTISATADKQAIYIDEGGTAIISGSSYLSNRSSNRAAVHNFAGTLTITGGTIVAQKFAAVVSASTTTIGANDGSVNKNAPILQGATYGATIVSNTTFNFYDGTIKGKNAAFDVEGNISDIEDDYQILHTTEVINKVTYNVARLVIDFVTITFDPGDGSSPEAFREVEIGDTIGTLPVPTLMDYTFDGWYTASPNSIEMKATDIVNEDMTLYAKWVHNSEFYIAQIGNTPYLSLAEAIAAVNNNAETTIKLIRNTSETVTIPGNRNIILDLQSFTLSSPDNNAVITNRSKLKIISGTISTASASTAAINNESSGNLTITGGRIIATGLRQAIYNNNGKVTISGTPYLEASAPERGTVQNLANGTITILGGTIVSKNQEAVSNVGTLIIGTKDGNIDINTPVLVGATNGVTNTKTFRFYDGILKGKNNAISGQVNELEDGSSIFNGTETIDEETYKIAYLT